MSDQSDRLRELDKRHVWHPFTQMQDWNGGTPVVIERAEGNELIDAEGRRYLDGVSSLWTNVHGHGRREILEAIRTQLEQVQHTTLLGLANVPAIELAARLAELAPGSLSKVFYSDSGSTAVEIALKQAFQYWQHRGLSDKRLFVHLDEAYHGDTLGAVAVGGIGLFHQVFGPLIVDALAVPTPALVGKASAIEALTRLLESRAQEIAALIIEPLVQGAGGMLIQPEGYLAEVAALCRRHEVLLIADEVATGFGRTGTMFACEHEGVEPDLMCLAKGISGGYLPLAATLATDDVYAAFLGEGRTFYHGHTYTGNPLACAAALASLELFQTGSVLAAVGERAARLGELLRELAESSAYVYEVRQRGLMVGVELRAPGGPFAPERRVGAQVCEAARGQGVMLRPLGDVIVLMPPLSITEEQLGTLVGAVAHGIDQVCGA